MLPLPLLAALACTPPGVELDGSDVVEPDPATGCDGAPCVEPTTEDDRVAYHRLVIDDRGMAWMSWVEAGAATERTMYVARSTEAGAPLEQIVAVPTAEAPIVGGSEKPGLAVAGDRMVISYTGVGDLRHGDAQAAYVQLGDIDAEGLVTFDDPIVLEVSSGGRWVLEQSQVATAPDGEAWVLYKRQDYGVRDLATWARESTGFTPQGVSDELSTNHECSPPDLLVTDTGEAVVALRSNVGGLLQTVVVTSAGVAQITDSRWEYNDAVCPEDGPRLAHLADGTWVAVWIEPIADGSLWRSWTSTSADGVTWTAPQHTHDSDVGLGERKPSVTAVDAGYIVSVEALDRSTRMWDHRVGGAGDVRALEAPGGVSLEQVELASGGGRTAALGVGDDGLLWLVEID